MRKLRGAGNTLLTNGTISKFPVLVHFGVCAEAALANEAVRSKPRKATGIRLSLILLLHIFLYSPQSQAHSIKYNLSESYAVQLIDAWRNAFGSVPTISNSKLCHNLTARVLVLITKLNCIARKLRLRARPRECSHIARATPRPVAVKAVMYPQFATCPPPPC